MFFWKQSVLYSFLKYVFLLYETVELNYKFWPGQVHIVWILTVDLSAMKIIRIKNGDDWRYQEMILSM